MMRTISRLCGLSLLLTVVLAVQAEPADPAGLLTAVLNGVESYSADFTQETSDADGRSLQKSTGRRFAERPGKFRWEADLPFEQIMISNGELLMIHDVDLDQAVQRRLDRQLVNTPALLLSGDVRGIANAFTITSGVGRAGEASFELRPRDPQSMFEAMRVLFRDGALVAMVLSDSLGQQTRIEFQNVALNQGVDDQLFAFDVPPGTDFIVEQ